MPEPASRRSSEKTFRMHTNPETCRTTTVDIVDAMISDIDSFAAAETVLCSVDVVL